ncbi:MAG: hypothetical protein AB7G35_21570 [Hyphomicrobiaceae bacterium]
MEYEIHATAPEHIPFFITAPGGVDVLFVIVAVFLVAVVLGFLVFFFWLHSLPERMVHNRIQFDLVAALALLSLFTHIHAFWVAALLIALIDLPRFSFPDFSSAMQRIAGSLEKIAEARTVLTNGKARHKLESENAKLEGSGRTGKTIKAGARHA